LSDALATAIAAVLLAVAAWIRAELINRKVNKNNSQAQGGTKDEKTSP